jgi:hypothetical protein
MATTLQILETAVVHQSAAKVMLEETVLLQPVIKVTSKDQVAGVVLTRLAGMLSKQAVMVKGETGALESSG